MHFSQFVSYNVVSIVGFLLFRTQINVKIYWVFFSNTFFPYSVIHYFNRLPQTKIPYDQHSKLVPIDQRPFRQTQQACLRKKKITKFYFVKASKMKLSKSNIFYLFDIGLNNYVVWYPSSVLLQILYQPQFSSQRSVKRRLTR